jgi:hypothetical protein
MLRYDFSQYPPTRGAFATTYNLNSSFSAALSFLTYNKNKKNYPGYSVIRAGFTFTPFQVDGPSYFKSEQTRLDTINPGNGTTIYDDSISERMYNFNWSGESIGIDISQLFHTNDQRIFSFWTGYGLHFGIEVNNAFHADYSEINYKQTTIIRSSPTASLYTSDSPSTYTYKNEMIRTKNTFASKIYFPIGMQIRFSRKNTFWNKLAFTTEVRSSMEFQPVPGNGIMTRFYFNENMGLKYYFENNATK